jgi:hypothetical protein
MTIKLLSPCPEDEGNTPMGNFAHTENSAAYKKFVAPKKEYKQIDLSEIDFESEAKNLNKKDILEKLDFLTTLSLSNRHTIHKVLLKNQETLIESLVNTVNYSAIHKSFNQLQIGFSSNWKVRKKEHVRNGWIILDAKAGSLKEERKVKDVIKEFRLMPVPASKEIFPITPELVNLLISLDWVGIKENKNLILTKDPQLDIDFGNKNE